MRGFTKTGQPIMGRKYRLLGVPVTVVGKWFGEGGNADLIGITCEGTNEDGSPWQERFSWPLLIRPSGVRVELVPGWEDDA